MKLGQPATTIDTADSQLGKERLGVKALAVEPRVEVGYQLLVGQATCPCPRLAVRDHTPPRARAA